MSSKASFKSLINGDKPLLIDFHATWCGPCKSLAPIIQEVAAELDDQMRVIKIDIDKNQNLSSKLGIRGVPTLLLYKDGKVVWRQSGLLSGHQIKEAVKDYL